MAALQRDQFVTELQVRGWDKFAASELQKYLDWALQLVGSKSKWEPYITVTTGIAIPTSGIVAMTAVDAVENIREIRRVFLTTSLYQRKIAPMDEDDFYETWYQEILKGAGIGQGAESPDAYFIHNKNLYFLPLPRTAFTCEVHYLKMPSVFSGATAVSGYPERFDKIILTQAEAICHKRGREFDAYQQAEIAVMRMIEEEQALDSATWREEPRRIASYR